MRIIRSGGKLFFGSSKKISSIPYHQCNLSILPSVLALKPDKQQLNSSVRLQLNKICPQLDLAKKQFNKLQQTVQNLYEYIKKQILVQADSELDGSFYQRAHYYFAKQGKKIRPLMIVMLAQNFKSILRADNPRINFQKFDNDIKKWCALMEIMHIASLAHDDIVDDSPSRRGQQSQHLKYGSKIAVFSGNYIISKASKTVSDFKSTRLYEIYAHAMASLAQGQIKQLIAKRQNKFVNEKTKKQKTFNQMMERYMEKTFFKSAALMCGSLLGVPSIVELNFGNAIEKITNKSFSQLQQLSFRSGQHYGLGLQLIDDILDYISTAQEMGKEEMADLIQGNVTAPVYLTYIHKDKIQEAGHGVTLQLLNKAKKNKDDALLVKNWVEGGVGIELTYILGSLHTLEGLNELRRLQMPEDQLLGWQYLGYKLMTRRK